jgi:TDG/mug DNA glycosylase family protein
MGDILKDLLTPNLKAVFCGTAAGTASARRGAYYAGPGNAFWPTLYKVGLTPRLFRPEEYEQLLELGLGLTDIVKTASGGDHELEKQHFDRDGLRRKISRFRPRIIAFTSKRAALEFLGASTVEYGLLDEQVGDTRLFVLPSPSGAARGHWDIAPWHELAARIGRAPGTG